MLTEVVPQQKLDFTLPDGVAGRILSPALLVSLDAVRHNIGLVIAALAGNPERWRPHLKTTKLPVVWRELLAAGLRSFKCATTREAAVFLELAMGSGHRGLDLLVAYPHRGPNLARLNQLAANSGGVRLAVLCEDLEGLAAAGPSLGVFIDLNSGMNRTGVPLDDRDTIERIARQAGEQFRGLHFYDGHIRSANAAERRTLVHEGLARLVKLIEWLQSRGVHPPEVVTSGTPGFLDAAAYQPLSNVALHRVSPGTVVFHDEATREILPELELRPAAMVLSRVVSRPAKDIVTCDAGSKSIAAEAGDPCCRVLGHPELTPLRPSEEHLPLRVAPTFSSEPSPSGRGQGAGVSVPIFGDILLLVPRHVCPTVNLADEAIIIENGQVRSMDPVAARGHEL